MNFFTSAFFWLISSFHLPYIPSIISLFYVQYQNILKNLRLIVKIQINFLSYFYLKYFLSTGPVNIFIKTLRFHNRIYYLLTKTQDVNNILFYPQFLWISLINAIKIAFIYEQVKSFFIYPLTYPQLLSSCA